MATEKEPNADSTIPENVSFKKIVQIGLTANL